MGNVTRTVIEAVRLSEVSLLDERLAINRVRGAYVVGMSKPPSTPIVKLIGCSTAVKRLPFRDPAGMFQFAGAAIFAPCRRSSDAMRPR